MLVGIILLLSIETACSAERVNGNRSGQFVPLLQRQTLYFRIYEVDVGSEGNAFLMNASSLNGETPRESQQASFVSLPLAGNFKFTNLTVIMHHTNVTTPNCSLSIEVGWLDVSNQSYKSHQDYRELALDTVVSSFSFATQCCGMNIFEQQRLWIHVEAEGEGLYLIWGDMAHDSRVTYDGTAYFIPEFPSIFILLILMALTLLTALISRKENENIS